MSDKASLDFPSVLAHSQRRRAQLMMPAFRALAGHRKDIRRWRSGDYERLPRS